MGVLKALFPARLGQWLGPLLVAGLIAAAIGLYMAFSGTLNLAAAKPDNPRAAGFIHGVFTRSVAAHARDIKVPTAFNPPAEVMRGAGHYARVCAHCHGAPGIGQGPIALSMNPRPQYLPAVAANFSDAELFWIIRNGVRMTAMPAWPVAGRDDEVWALVAFVRMLPKQTAGDYIRLAYGNPAAQPVAPGVAPFATGFKPQPYPLPSSKGPTPGQFNYQWPAVAFGNPALLQGAVQTCVACHGAEGAGRVGGAFPNLAILDPSYFTATLINFANGTRTSGIMQSVAAQLTPAQITALGSYYGSLPKRGLNTDQPPAAVLAKGSAIAANGAANGSISACNACHTSIAAGTGIPAIAGQNLDYLRTQLRLFRSGERKDPKSFNPMPAEAHALTDAELDDVARYFAAQPVVPPPAPAAAAAPAKPAA